jgi:hypothetical protein
VAARVLHRVHESDHDHGTASQQVLAVSQGMAGCGGMLEPSQLMVDISSGTVSFVLPILIDIRPMV